MKKGYKYLVVALSLIVYGLSLFGCNTAETKKSEISGFYTFKQTISNLSVKHNVQNSGTYLLANKAPYDWGLEDKELTYQYSDNHSLRMKKNYTYVYEYTVSLSAEYSWGTYAMGSISVNCAGTYAYRTQPDGTYVAILDTPTDGELSCKSWRVEQASWGFNVSKYGGYNPHEDTDYSVSLTVFDNLETSEISEYVCGLSFLLKKSVLEDEENAILNGTLLHLNLINLLGQYSTIKKI
jgi:hypothetical protein